MKLGRISVLGGGPGGLYAARLLKLAHPEASVDVHERLPSDETFGFGVGLATATQRKLAQGDEATYRDIMAATHAHAMSMQVGDDVAGLEDDLRGIGRATLLDILQRHARDAGVRLHFESRVGISDLEADLVIAADGVSSATREQWAADFGATVETSRGLYLWCGTELALPTALFSPATTEHGTFVTHAYPYAKDRSTFLIETDEATWQRAGFDRTTLDEHGTDVTSLAYLERAFAKPLNGHRLIGNRTRWLRFRTVRCARWHRRNVVLLGDAAHTAHYSIGSGTKLAMEDAIALRDALTGAPDLESALAGYETARRPAVEHLQAIAARSLAWWDAFPARLHMPAAQLLVAYMTRAGKVPLERFAASAPHVVGPALRAFAGTEPDLGAVVEWVLAGRIVEELPANARRIPFDGTDAWSPEADAIVAEASPVTVVVGPDDRERVLDRLELAERLKLAGHTVIAEVPAALRSDAAAALASARIDRVRFTDPVRARFD